MSILKNAVDSIAIGLEDFESEDERNNMKDETSPPRSIKYMHLPSLDIEAQIETVRGWFLERYKDPIESNPSSDGYNHIFIGPNDIKDMLYETFQDFVKTETIDIVVAELIDQSSRWVNELDDSIIDPAWLDPTLPTAHFRQIFIEAIEKIDEIININIESKDIQNSLNRLLFANIIFALETYLSDAFIGRISSNRQCLINYVKNDKDISKMSLGKAFSITDSVEDTSKKYLISQSWHNIKRVKEMYKFALSCDFPKDISSICTAIEKRHDIVHRNGRDKETGVEILISKQNIQDLIKDVTKLVDHIDIQLSNSTP